MEKLKITINSDVFEDLREDFDCMLLQLLGKMRTDHSEEGTLSVRVGVKLEEENEVDALTGEVRKVTKPSFSHKVGVALQYKDEIAGYFVGDYEMEWDPEVHAYVLVPALKQQASLFEEGAEE